MFMWIINKVAKPLLPILCQAYVVVDVVEYILRTVLGQLDEANKIYKNIKAMSEAATTVKAALFKIILALGGVTPVTARAKVDLNEEVNKLKDLL